MNQFAVQPIFLMFSSDAMSSSPSSKRANTGSFHCLYVRALPLFSIQTASCLFLHLQRSAQDLTHESSINPTPKVSGPRQDYKLRSYATQLNIYTLQLKIHLGAPQPGDCPCDLEDKESILLSPTQWYHRSAETGQKLFPKSGHWVMTGPTYIRQPAGEGILSSQPHFVDSEFPGSLKPSLYHHSRGERVNVLGGPLLKHIFQ